jgi:endonuclease I
MDNEVGICVMTEQCGVLYDSVRNLTGDELKLALQQLTGQRYNPIEYDVSRKIMYREIDKDENNEVQCVYTGRKMKVIEGEELDSRSGDCNIRTCNCGNPGMNTEHTWPQGQFDKLEPMKGDVHHLFPADACTNGRRSSFKFGNVVAPEGTFGSISYKDEYGNEYGMSKLGRTNGQTVFEPPLIHKGDVARAIFYFIIRYGNYSNYLDDTQEATLRQWAIDDPVSSKERIRNNKIEKLQWNRNPFVDCPQLIDVIPDF